MNLSSLSVRRGITFTMIYLILVGFGIFGLSQLELDLYPDITFPGVVIITNYTGASPEDIETLITKPIEGAVAAAKDAKDIQSTSKQGASVVMIEFDWGKDMEQAETDVRRKLDLIKDYLPDDASEPVVFAFDPSLQPIVIMTITGPYPLDELRQIAEDEIEPRLARLPGIADAEVAGGLQREIHVVLDPVKIAAFGLDVNQVIGAVHRENTQVPGGSIDQGGLEYIIQTEGKYQSVKEIGEVVVGSRMGSDHPVPVTLKEVAKVEDSFVESNRILEVDGQPTVWMMVRKQSGANTVKAARAVMNELPEIKRAAAAEIDFKMIFNQADIINKSLGNLSNTALLGVFITFLVLLFFLRNIRSSLIVAAAIPTSVIATFFVMYMAGMTLNVLSMAGLALAIGMLVDNAIVVLENIFRLREEGTGTWQAAIEGSRTVSMAVTASTLTTIAVFVPILFVPGIAGVMFKDMAVTICFSLTVSLIVSLSLIPLGASRLLGGARATRLLEAARKKDVMGGLREHYGRWLDWVLDRRWVVAAGLGAALLLTGALYAMMPLDFIRQGDQNMLFIQVETAVGNNVQETEAITKEVVAAIKKVVKPEERKLIAEDIGVGEGFVSIFAKGNHAATLRVPLVDRSQRKRSQAEIEAALREELKKIPGIKASVQQPFSIMGEGDIEIQIRGHDLKESRRIGLELKETLLAMPEMAEANFSMDDQKPEVRVRFDRRKMAQLGLSTAAAGTAISAYFQGTTAGSYAEGGDEYDILVRYGKDYRKDLSELRRMPVATPTGAFVPLGNIASVDEGLGPVDITRLDQARITRITCTLKDTYTKPDGSTARKDLGGAIKRVDRELSKYPWPQDFSYHIGGSAEDFLDSMRYLGLALVVAIFLVYMVMASQFESLLEPFIIIFTVPLAAIGVVLMFTLTRSTMDVTALIGVVMLVGIVVNNGIVMIDAANQLREKGLGRREAAARAAVMRLRPVLMTSATTILAMIPLALEIGEGSAGWAGMAKAVIGGLTSATFLTLFVVPTMYTVFAKKVYVSTAEKIGAPTGGEA